MTFSVKGIVKLAYRYSPSFAKEVESLLLPSERLFRKYIRELEESQWYSPQQLEELQNEKLRRIIWHAYDNVPYYRKIFDERSLKPKDIQCGSDLKRLPILNKDDVRRNFNELQAENKEQYKPTLRGTSGSTGMPLKFLLDRNNMIWERAHGARSRLWGGVKGIYKGADLHSSVLGDKFYQFDHSYRTTLILSSFHLNPDNINKYVKILNEFSPQYIHGYPSALHYLCKLMLEKGLNSTQPVMIQTASEILLPSQRKIIEEQFRCKVFNYYGNSEHVSSISECEKGGYHIHSEYGIIEFVNQSREATKEGELSEMICTGLNNFSMPLIRYYIGDTAINKSRKCSCGRGLPLVDSLEGRTNDVIITSDGRNIPASGMTLAFNKCENIIQYQLVQNDVDELVINIQKTKKYSQEDHDFMLSQVRSRIGAEMRVVVNFVDDIPRTAAGKYKFMISNILQNTASQYRDC